jgi:hypothetical protein
MFGRGRVKDLKKNVDFLREKLDIINKELTSIETTNHAYKRLFGELFNRLSASNVSKYKVTKDLTNINDEKTLFCVKYDDGRSFVFEVKLISTEYEEDINGQVNKTRKD